MNDTTDNHVPAQETEAASSVTPSPLSLSDRVRSLRLPDASTPVAGSVPWWPIVLGMLLAASPGAAALAYIFVAPPAQQAAKLEEKATITAEPRPAPTAAVGEVVLESMGYIVPVHQIQVSPKVSGMLQELRIIEGMQVKKGDILAQLETVDYQSDVDHSIAAVAASRQRLLELTNGNRPEEIEQAKAELAEAKAQLKQLKLDWERSVSLQGGQAMAQRDYEQAVSAYEAMLRRVDRLGKGYDLMVKGPRDERKDAAQADVQQAEADLVKAKWRLDSCTIRAPVTGTILTKKAEEGNIVNPIAFNVSASLCDMADLSDLEVDLNIQERDIMKVIVNQQCRIRPTAFASRVYEGSVSRLMPIADRSKGTVPVRVKVIVPAGEEGKFLKPEMSVTVSFLKVTK